MKSDKNQIFCHHYGVWDEQNTLHCHVSIHILTHTPSQHVGRHQEVCGCSAILRQLVDCQTTFATATPITS